MSDTVITNPNPIAPGACNKYWIASLTLSNPLFSATLRPFDGQFVVGNASKAKQVVADASKDSAAAAVVTAAFAQITRLSGNAAAVEVVTYYEADPLAPVAVTAVFADGSTFSIPERAFLGRRRFRRRRGLRRTVGVPGDEIGPVPGVGKHIALVRRGTRLVGLCDACVLTRRERLTMIYKETHETGKRRANRQCGFHPGEVRCAVRISDAFDLVEDEDLRPKT